VDTPTREIYWNVSAVWLMYVLLVPTAAVLLWGLWRRVRRWRMGRPVDRTDRPRARLRALLDLAVAQRKILRDRYSGIMHQFIFLGFLTLFVGTLVVMVHEDFKIPIMQGPFYLWFQSLALDLLGLAAIIGLVMGLVKRYLLRAHRLDRTKNPDWILPVWFLVILITGFMVEGLRIVGTADPWAIWSPVGYATGRAFAAAGLTGSALRVAHRGLWWLHLVIVFGWLAYLPYTKLRHIFISPASIYFRRFTPRGRLDPINLETAPVLGAKTLGEFHWKDLLDLDACTECGLCQAACPAFAVGKPLNPKAVILDLQAHMYARATTADTAAGASLVGPVILPETIWSCTTCFACVEACPVEIEHVSKIVDMRRYVVMEESDLPDGAAAAIQGIEDRGHPFRGTGSTRRDWYRDLPYVQEMAVKGSADLLFWVGCATALNERNHSIARALAMILHRAGIDFAVLGEEEGCSGDPARRIGNEYLFQQQAKQNIETLRRYGVTRIVTTCPHCMNTIKHEYPEFGGTYDVVHHTQLIAELQAQGRLPAPPRTGTVTFHDPCYLGRVNGEYEAPRQAIDALGLERVEMPRSGRNSFCCGAGGGRYWMDDRPGQRINVARAQEGVATGAETIGTACPFCMLMIEDGVKQTQAERHPRTLDVAELVAESLDG
jgi:Fe-S oxidoreductase/nitrate reductase gamma subunit